MSQLNRISGRRRRRRGPWRRWSAAEKAWYRDAFQRSGLSGEAFCREMRVPRATFALWKREWKREAGGAASDAAAAPRERVAFARVELMPTAATARGAAAALGGEVPAVMRVVVRGASGHEAALERVDCLTALRLVALVLGDLGGGR